jgi:diguanylate cyclase (GGDEF)-like protein
MMVRFRKNIWMIYLLIFIVSVILMLSFSIFLYRDNQQRFLIKQQTRIELFSSSIVSFLKNQDSLLDILGHSLISKHADNPSPLYDADLDSVMRANSAILGLGLAAYDGRPLAASSNFKLDQLPNLMTLDSTKASFSVARDLDKLAIGPTYQINALDTTNFAIPLRRAIHNLPLESKAVAVMMAGIRIDHRSIFGANPELEPFHQIQIVRTDGFAQYISQLDGQPSDYLMLNPNDYTVRIEQPLLDQLSSLIADKSATTKDHSAHFIYQSTHFNAYQVVALYDPFADMWFVSSINQQAIDQQFLDNFYLLLLAFVSFNAIFYLTFRSLANSELTSRKKLHYQAQHDSLTTLPNRQYLRDNVDLWFSDTQSTTRKFSLLYIDLDNFKSVNDSYGHEYGDKVLIQATQRLLTCVTEYDLLVRESSDEFILLTENTNQGLLVSLTKRISNELTQPYQVSGNNVSLGACIGISMYPRHGKNLNELLTAADIALLRAKQKLNTTHFFSAEMQAEHLYKVRLEQKLRNAIELDMPFLVYQPLLDTHGRVYGVEALVRWKDDELGYVNPEVFIAIAESSGLMPRLGWLIVDMALRDIAALNQTLSTDIRVSINISVCQFLLDNFSVSLLKRIAASNVSPTLITLEITENLFIEDLQAIKPICLRLQQQGMKISLDDFGTGYSSLNMLSNLPIDELKIDKSFVDKMEENQRSLSMIRNIIAIGKNLAMTVHAEGVETDSQRRLLLDYDCDQFQGYFFAKPLSCEDLQAYILSTNS